jgi:magnesium-transporting ATPase (P-type)
LADEIVKDIKERILYSEMENNIVFNVVLMLAAVWISIYTFSFGVWTWKKKNKFGAFIVMLIALVTTVLPFIYLFL